MININRFLSPEIFTIYGPLTVHTYGFMISLGLIALLYCAQRDTRRARLIGKEQLTNIIMLGLIVGIAGGRLLHVLENISEFLDDPADIIRIWDGGLSVLGSIIAIVLIMPWYLRAQKLAIVPLFDLVATYAPLMQSIARIGCLAAGCCYGLTSHEPWAIFYTNPKVLAPLFQGLIPTQIYHSMASLGIFLILRFVISRAAQPGVIFASYLALESAARFSIDFLRSERGELYYGLSIDQLCALAIFIAIFRFALILRRQNTPRF